MRRFAVLALLVLAACGGGTISAGKSPGQPATADGLTAAARGVAQALINADTQLMYQSLDAACQAKVNYATFAEQMRTANSILESGGRRASDISANIEVRNVTATSGEVRVKLIDNKQPGLTSNPSNSFQPWVYEQGAWRSTNCAFSSDSSTTPTT